MIDKLSLTRQPRVKNANARSFVSPCADDAPQICRKDGTNGRWAAADEDKGTRGGEDGVASLLRTHRFAVHIPYDTLLRPEATVPCCLQLLPFPGDTDIPDGSGEPCGPRRASIPKNKSEVTQRYTDLRDHSLATITTTITTMSVAKRPTLLRETTSRRIGSLSPSATSTSGPRGGHGGYSSSSGSSSSQEDEASSASLSVRTNNRSYL